MYHLTVYVYILVDAAMRCRLKLLIQTFSDVQYHTRMRFIVFK